MTPNADPQTRSERNADQTRQRILEAAFQAIYRNGFQGMRLEEVIMATGLTKGALYHHFPNKLALGYAVVDELLSRMVRQAWVLPLDAADDPLEELTSRIATLNRNFGDDVAILGCPLNNLAQEMSPLDEGFRTRINALLEEWQNAVIRALDRGKAQGRLARDLDSRNIAILVMAGIEGCIGMAKSYQQIDRLVICQNSLADYLRSLRLPTAG